MMLEIQSNLTSINFNKRETKPAWIVIHYTGNNGDTAYNNTSYFKSVNRGASANYFVDEKSIWKCVEDTDTAWHVGNDTYYNAARNTNSIGIEMCSYIRSGGNKNTLSDYRIKADTYSNAISLTQYLMEKYSIPIDRVSRHYDVTGKICPAPLVYNADIITWEQFKERVSDTGLSQKDVQSLVNTSLSPLISRVDVLERKYNYVSDCPEWSKTAIQYLLEIGVLVGVDSNLDIGNDVYVKLTYDMCRLAVMTERIIKREK